VDFNHDFLHDGTSPLATFCWFIGTTTFSKMGVRPVASRHISPFSSLPLEVWNCGWSEGVTPENVWKAICDLLHSTPCLKNVPPLTCYNLDTHDPITIIFGRRVTGEVRSHMVLCFPTSPIWCFSITLQKRKPRRQRTGTLRVQHSPTAVALSTSFLLNHAPNSPTAEHIDCKI